MELTPFTIYLFGIADSVQTAFLIASVISVGLGIPLLVACVNDDVQKKWPAIALACTLVFGSLTMLTPSKETLAMMYVLPKVADSEVIRKDVPEIYDIAMDALKSHLTKKTAEAK